MNLDMTVLEDILEIEAGGESGLLQLLFDSYFEQAPELMARLKNGVASGDWTAVEATAHSLKSSSAALGLKDLAASLANVEHHAKDRAAAEEIQTSFAQACTLLEPSLKTLRDFVALKAS